MTKAELDAAGRRLYDACRSVKPSWDQLGEVTKSVWIERVGIVPEAEPWYNRGSGEMSCPDPKEK